MGRHCKDRPDPQVVNWHRPPSPNFEGFGIPTELVATSWESVRRSGVDPAMVGGRPQGLGDDELERP